MLRITASMETRASLLSKAARFRRIASALTDEHAATGLRKAADQCEARAIAIEVAERPRRTANLRERGPASGHA
jgi:hypothetical protein